MAHVPEHLEEFFESVDEFSNSVIEYKKVLANLARYLESDPSQRQEKHRQQSDVFFSERPKYGHFAITFEPRIWTDETRFRKYYRMSRSTFVYILEGIQDQLQRSSHRAISPKERLVVTLRYVPR